jgi:hypothetical protein
VTVDPAVGIDLLDGRGAAGTEVWERQRTGALVQEA